MNKKNYNSDVINNFGEEWEAFDQTSVSQAELEKQFQDYFKLFPWGKNITNGTGADLGCGSGRWARHVAEKVDMLICIDASSKAINVANKNSSEKSNCVFLQAKIDQLPLNDSSLDFAYSLGVLHHLPDTAQAIHSCVRKLKSNAPLLLYLYYAFDNRPTWYAMVWRCSDLLRKLISKLPFIIKYPLCNIIAGIIYFPLARTSYVMEKLGFDVKHIPLSEYRKKSFYTMRTDALDRFGTRLENRFTREEIKKMMEDAGLINIQFSDIAPYWCAVGTKA